MNNSKAGQMNILGVKSRLEDEFANAQDEISKPCLADFANLTTDEPPALYIRTLELQDLPDLANTAESLRASNAWMN